MRILILQLKRIGDLILTTPAITALRRARPDARITLVVAESCAGLLPAIEGIEHAAVFRRNSVNASVLKQVASGFDACLDFSGTDRSAFLTGLSRAKQRVAFEWVRKSRLRSLAYNQFVDSPAREFHTVEHYLHLLRGLGIEANRIPVFLHSPASARARAIELLRANGVAGRFALIHPGSARVEKYWLPERWSEVIATLRRDRGLDCVLTGGDDDFELAHLSRIRSESANLAGRMDLLTLAALVEQARIVISCDTAIVHLAAAFQTPQIALFGPTNPFHWRPLHARASIISATHPDGPLAEFQPRMKGAPMERISTEAVIRATNALLQKTEPEAGNQA